MKNNQQFTTVYDESDQAVCREIDTALIRKHWETIYKHRTIGSSKISYQLTILRHFSWLYFPHIYYDKRNFIFFKIKKCFLILKYFIFNENQKTGSCPYV